MQNGEEMSIKYAVVLLLIISLDSATKSGVLQRFENERAVDEKEDLGFFLIPSITTANPGLIRHWVWQGIEAGIIVNEHHCLSITGRLSLRTVNAHEQYDLQEGKNSKEYDYLIWGTAYGSYIYDYSFTSFLRVGAGVSVGWQYVETDRNFDTTGVHSYRASEDGFEQIGELHLRHEAEGRSHSFGGPLVQIALGWERIYFHTRFRLNIGIRENWGYYWVKDSGVTEIYFPKDYYIMDVKISDSGWHEPMGFSLFKELYLLPEYTFGILILI